MNESFDANTALHEKWLRVAWIENGIEDDLYEEVESEHIALEEDLENGEYEDTKSRWEELLRLAIQLKDSKKIEFLTDLLEICFVDLSAFE